jgi:general secretion pathway protein N
MSFNVALWALPTALGLAIALTVVDAMSRELGDQHRGYAPPGMSQADRLGRGLPAGATRNRNPSSATPLSSLSATRDRPIFSPSRRAVAKSIPVRPTPPVTNELPPLALLGTISGEAGDIAIFLDRSTKRLIRLRTGESHFGWTLEVVSKREATLRMQGKKAAFTISNPPAK